VLAAAEPAPKNLSRRREPARGDLNWLEREELKDPRARSSHHYNPALAGFFFGGYNPALAGFFFGGGQQTS
jgi:hypothetical protein